jgi:hypothetical protein
MPKIKFKGASIWLYTLAPPFISSITTGIGLVISTLLHRNRILFRAKESVVHDQSLKRALSNEKGIFMLSFCVRVAQIECGDYE